VKNHLEDPEFIKKLKYFFYISLGITVIIGFFVHPKSHFWWEKIPGFYAIYGFAACVLIIFGAKALGNYWLKREEGYYD
jgi:hypothetical protein